MANCLNVGFIGKLFLPSILPFSQRSSSLSSFSFPLPPWLICFVRCHLCSPPCDFLSFNLYFFPMSPQGHAPQTFTETNSRGGGGRCHTRTHRNMRIHTSLNSTSGVKPSERLQWERKTQMPPSHTHDETQNKIWRRRRFDFYDKFALIFLYADYIRFTVHCKCVGKASRTACWKTAGTSASPLIFGGAVFAWCHRLISIDFKGVSATHIGTMW